MSLVNSSRLSSDFVVFDDSLIISFQLNAGQHETAQSFFRTSLSLLLSSLPSEHMRRAIRIRDDVRHLIKVWTEKKGSRHSITISFQTLVITFRRKITIKGPWKIWRYCFSLLFSLISHWIKSLNCISPLCVCVRCVCNRRNHYIWNSVHVETSLTWETGHRAANYLFYLLFFIVFASSSSIFGTCAEWRINVVCLKPIKLRWIIRRMYAIRGILYFRWKNSYEHLTKWDKCTRSKQKPNVYLCISVFLFIFVAIHEIPSLMTHLYTKSPSFIKGNFQINFSRCPTHD